MPDPLRDHADRVAASHGEHGWRPGDALPHHQPNCYGCGPDNHAGFGLRTVADGENGVRAELSLDQRFEGAPGLAHGGALSAVLDDVLGSVILRALVPAVTRELNVTYRRPVRLDEPLTVTAQLDDRDGRTLFLSGEILQDDRTAVSVQAVFVEVDPARLGFPAS